MALLGVSLCAIVPPAAYGQTKTWVGESIAGMVEAARWRLGNVRANASLSFSNVGYDTDVYYGYLDRAFPDFTLFASLPMQVLFPLGKKTLIEVNDRPGYNYYGKTKEERAWNNMLGGRVHINLDRVYFGAGGGLGNVRRRLSPELDINVQEKTDLIDGTILWQTSQSLSLAALYNYTRYDYGKSAFDGEELANSLNRREDFIDLIAYVQPNTKVRLFIDGQYGRYTFAETASSERNTQSYGIFAGLGFIPPGKEAGSVESASGNISLGYKRFDIIDIAYRDGSGLVGAVDVSIGFLKKTTARAYFSKDFAFSVFSDAAFYQSTSYGIGIGQRLSRKATLAYDLTFGRSTDPEDRASESSLNRDLFYINHSFALTVRLARYLGATFQAILARREIGGTGDWKNRNFFGMSLEYGSPPASIAIPVRGISR
jgi:hypothetical protein